jgi:hypothetical protein
VNYFEQSVNPRTAMPATAIGTVPGMSDITRFVTDGLVVPLLRGLGQVAVNFSDSMGGLAARRVGADRDRPRKHECGCEAENPCHCTCCIVDADVVIYAYLGERRLFPIVIENDRRREKKVRLTLGDFTTHAGKPAPIKGMLLPPTEFELGPCASKNIVMVIDGSVAEQDGQTKAGSRAVPDVEGCTVYYADLRVDGCEMRPLRIAVAIAPRDCGAYRINCHSCCC